MVRLLRSLAFADLEQILPASPQMHRPIHRGNILSQAINRQKVQALKIIREEAMLLNLANPPPRMASTSSGGMGVGAVMVDDQSALCRKLPLLTRVRTDSVPQMGGNSWTSGSWHTE